MKLYYALLVIVSAGFLLTEVAYAQQGQVPVNTDIVTSTFTSEEPDQSVLERRSRLSERYITGVITNEESIELKELRPNFADLDRYKIEYDLLSRDREPAAPGEFTQPDIVPENTSTVTNGAYLDSELPMKADKSLTGALSVYTDLALPLTLINTLLILMLLVRKPKVAQV